jgi:hypothetical protein
MINEYTGLDLDCMHEEGLKYCDPLATFNSPEGIKASMSALLAVYIGSSSLAWFILTRLSSKYE